jgi:hypothetical protein
VRLTASEKLMQKLIHMATGERIESPDAIRQRYNSLPDNDEAYDALQRRGKRASMRGGEEETSLPCPGSRLYETKSVAAPMLDGTWVGWTYFYGGGKHGEPEVDAVD